MERLLEDIRFSIRTLIRKPTFTMWTLLTLTLALGANTAIFSVVNAILIKPLPYREPERIVVVRENNLGQGVDDFNASLSNFIDWQQQTSTFARMAAYRTRAVSLIYQAEATRLSGAQVSPSLFAVLGVSPVLGQTFSDEQNPSAVANSVVLSNRIWRTKFYSDRGILGQAINLDGKAYNVVGVMPADFEFPLEVKGVDLWLPLSLETTNANRGSHLYQVIALLNPGVSINEAQTEISTIASRLAMQYPDTNAGWGARLTTLKDYLVKDVRSTLLILMLAVGVVLLIACANLANLLLSRAIQRQKEIAIRTALGASRVQIIIQLLTENLILALASGALGLVLAYWGVSVLVSIISQDVPRLENVDVDVRVIGFTLAVSVLTAIGFGLVPALVTSRGNLNSILNENSARGSSGKRHKRTSQLLVIFEVSLALVLLTGAGLLVKSFNRLQQVNPGFNPEGVFTARLSLPPTKYTKKAQWASTFQDITQRVQTLPGVQDSGGISYLPFTGDKLEFDFEIEGVPVLDPSQQPAAAFYAATAGYFNTLKIPLIKGRYITDADTEEAAKVIVINQELAERYFGNEDPVGRKLLVSYGPPIPREVVGIVGNVKYASLDTKPEPQLYAPYSQIPLPFMSLVLRTDSAPASMAAIRQKVLEVDKEIPLFKPMSLTQLASDSLGHPRFRTMLLSVFSVLALLMAGIGIYSVISYSVSNRVYEIGIRMALGATPLNIFKLILKDGMLLALIGEVIGIVGAFAVAPIMASFLYDVGTWDYTIFTLIPLFFALIAFLACSVPARRASSLQPTEALRTALT